MNCKYCKWCGVLNNLEWICNNLNSEKFNKGLTVRLSRNSIKSGCNQYSELTEIDEMPEIYIPPKTEVPDTNVAKQFESGAIRDNQDGKGRMDLLPWQAIIELSKHCENGAKHYGERNIDKGIPISNLMSSTFRHMAQYMEGAKNEDHLRAALWNIAWAMQFEVTKPEMQDIPNRKAQAFYVKEGVE